MPARPSAQVAPGPGLCASLSSLTVRGMVMAPKADSQPNQQQRHRSPLVPLSHEGTADATVQVEQGAAMCGNVKRVMPGCAGGICFCDRPSQNLLVAMTTHTHTHAHTRTQK